MISIFSSASESPLVHLVFLTLLALFIGIIIRFSFFKLLNVFSDRKHKNQVKALSNRFKGSIFLFIPAIIIKAYLSELDLPDELTISLHPILETIIIISFTIILVRLIFFIQDVLLMRYNVEEANNIKARQAVTQIHFLRKMIVIIMVIISLSLILLQFEGVRRYGATLLTSAGVAGIIIGFAAQKTIGNLMAGLQIAFTQPIKMGDAVIVEKEWGWIEEINLTYVVVKVWDMRRLVVPITYFTEKPFQNWTRNSADIMGSVFLFTDYSIPIDKLRIAFEGFLEETPLWDRAAKSLQVVDCTEKTMQLRLLMTAKDSPTAWDLRCFIREKMLVFIQENYPDALPKTRLNFEQPDKIIKED